MKKIITLGFIISACLMGQAIAGPNHKFNGQLQSNFTNNSYEKVQIAEHGKSLSGRDVLQIINSIVPGEASDIRQSFENGRKVFIVRWEPSESHLRGKIIIFVVDAETGQILKRSGG